MSLIFVRMILASIIEKRARHLEKLERDGVLRSRTVQGQGGDTGMGGHRLEKGFMGVDNVDS